MRGVSFSGNASKAICLDVAAHAENPGKAVYNADVFGRVYDVNGESLLDDVRVAA